MIFLAKEKPEEVWYVFILWFASVIHNWHTLVIQATMGSNLVFSVKRDSCHLQDAISEHHAHYSESTSGDSSDYFFFFNYFF